MMLKLLKVLTGKSRFRRGMDQWAEEVHLDHKKKKTDTSAALEKRRRDAQAALDTVNNSLNLAKAMATPAVSRKAARKRRETEELRAQEQLLLARVELMAAEARFKQFKKDLRNGKLPPVESAANDIPTEGKTVEGPDDDIFGP